MLVNTVHGADQLASNTTSAIGIWWNNHVAWCWKPGDAVSANNAGFMIWDTLRTSNNVMDGILAANLTIAEQVGAGNIADALSNGFKLRTTSTSVNGSRTYIFAAFAEASFKYATAR